MYFGTRPEKLRGAESEWSGLRRALRKIKNIEERFGEDLEKERNQLLGNTQAYLG